MVFLFSCEKDIFEEKVTSTLTSSNSINSYNLSHLNKYETEERLQNISTEIQNFSLSGEDPFKIEWGEIDYNKATQVRVDNVVYVTYDIITNQNDEHFFINLVETSIDENLVGLHYQGYILSKNFYTQYTDEGSHLSTLSGYTIKQTIVGNESNCSKFLIYPVDQPRNSGVIDGTGGDFSGYITTPTEDNFFNTMNDATDQYWGWGGESGGIGSGSSNGDSTVSSVIKAVGEWVSETSAGIWRWLRNLYLDLTCGHCSPKSSPVVEFPENGLLMVHPSFSNTEIEEPDKCRELTLAIIGNEFSIKYISTILEVSEEDIIFLLNEENAFFFAKCLLFLDDGEYKNSVLDNFKKALSSYKDTANSPTVEEKLILDWANLNVNERAEIISFLNNHVNNGIFKKEALLFTLEAILIKKEGGDVDWELATEFMEIKEQIPEAKLIRFFELNEKIQRDPWALIQDCAQQNGMNTQDYQDLYNHITPQACQNRLSTLGPGYFDQPISEGNVPLANIDYYGVEITNYPDLDGDGNSDTETEIYQAFREKFTDLASGEKDDFQFSCDILFNSTNTGDINWEFKPFTSQDEIDFISNNPISSILLIEADASGFLPTIATDDGAIMVTGYTNNDWTISTISTLENGSQPFSGNRQWGWIINQNGSLELFTRAVDVANISALLNVGANTECQQETYYDIAEATWQNLQQEIADWINSNGGQATVNTPETVRVKKETIKEVLTGNESIDQILSNCN